MILSASCCLSSEVKSATLSVDAIVQNLWAGEPVSPEQIEKMLDASHSILIRNTDSIKDAHSSESSGSEDSVKSSISEADSEGYLEDIFLKYPSADENLLISFFEKLLQFRKTRPQDVYEAVAMLHANY